MDLELIRLKFMQQLSTYLDVTAIKSHVFPTDKLRHELKHEKIIAFEFFIDGVNRYHTFAIEQNGEFMFTRPKEGISHYLISEVRLRDFYYQLTGVISNRRDLIGRFLENWINFEACCIIKDFIAEAAKDFNGVYTVGYKILRHHKHSLTFDGVFELLVSDRPDNEYALYVGKFVNGEFTNLWDINTFDVELAEVFKNCTTVQ